MSMWSTILQTIISFFKTVSLKPMEVEAIPETPIVPAPEPVKPIPQTPGDRLYTIAKSCLGTDASPNDEASDEYGCADSVNQIYLRAFGRKIANPGISTTQLYIAMLDNPNEFEKVTEPTAGDIIISPTNYGNGSIPNGHVGIVAKFGVMSNDSATGLWKENYTLAKWRDHYQKLGGYPVVFFRRV